MNTEISLAPELSALKLTDLLHYGNQAHLVYSLGETQYVSIRPLIDQIGLEWRTQKRGLLDEESILAYGVLIVEGDEILHPPCKTSRFLPKIPTHESDKPVKIGVLCAEFSQKDTLLMPIKRVYKYLNRISPGHVRGKGNHDAALYLEAKQDEWAEALADYELKGIAAKKDAINQRDIQEKTLMRLVVAVRAKDNTEDQSDRKILDQVMRVLGANCGIETQIDLFDSEGGVQ
jgi:hypothetical protein